MHGINGKILRINLSTADYAIEDLPKKYLELYLGGRGIIVEKLLTEVPQGIDPFEPANKLIFALGPFTGHPLLGSGRNSVGGISPLTGGFGEAEVGGYWGAEFKKTGFDAIIFEGKASSPVYIWIKNRTVEIRDAHKIWGLDVIRTDETIKNEIGDKKVRISAIGPAGERRVRFACIANDIRHFAGRCGLGALMGSKNLKAVAVRGESLPEMADSEEIKKLSRWMGKNYKELSWQWEYGTGLTMEAYEASGNLPINNFTGGRFPGIGKITPQFMFENSYVKKMQGCFACPIRCKRVLVNDESREVDPACGAPEYETLAALGPNCGIDDLEAIIKANELCCKYGMDTISTGVTISFAMECFEKGILSERDTDGIKLVFGNAAAMIEMVEKIAHRQGVGDILAEGSRRAAELIGKGSSEFAMHVRGEEIPMHEPRFKPGMGLHYSVHCTGADHCSGFHDNLMYRNLRDWERFIAAENIPASELSLSKARALHLVTLWRQLANYLGICNFLPYDSKQKINAFEWITGIPMSSWKIMQAVERGITLARILNLRFGAGAQDDKLPEKFFTDPVEGPLKDSGLDPQKFRELQKIYYQILGWNENGIPTYGTLVKLRIEWAAEYLKQTHLEH